ncbi:MAG: hypothetical protein RBR85_01640 [Bacilli bacterium]|jgi:hypothetical protein|nr:hypothetical protein [Bacilli bacterium]
MEKTDDTNLKTNEVETPKKVENKNNGPLISFFVFELLAITAFTLSSSVLLYGVLSLLSLIFVVFFGIKDLKVRQMSDFFIFLIPITIFALLTSISKFSQTNVAQLLNIFSFVAVLAFAFIGYFSKRVKEFKISTALMVIYGALAALVFISLILTMIHYIPFYPFIYGGKIFYYNGDPYPAYADAKMLIGFTFGDVSLEYFSLFSTLLFTSVIALRFLSPKNNKQEFILYSIYAGLGFISLLFTVNIMSLITNLFVVLFLLFLTFYPKKGKPITVLRIIFYVLLGVILVLFILFFLNAQSEWASVASLQNLLSSNHLTNKFFNGNHISLAIKQLLDGSLSSSWFNYQGSGYSLFVRQMFSNSLIFDSIITSGLLGIIALLTFLVLVYISLKKYYQTTVDSNVAKHSVVAFVGTFFLYSFLALDSSPETHILYIQPVTSNAMFLIVMYLIGYSYTNRKDVKQNEKEVVVHEQ